MKKLVMITMAALMGLSVSNAQDPMERMYLYPVLNAQKNNGRIAPKPKVEGFATERVTENLDRGVVAVQYTEGRMYVGWRLKQEDPEGVAFNVYRSVDGGRFSKLNNRPLTQTTDYIDSRVPAGKQVAYMVRAVVDGREQGDSEVAAPMADGLNYTSIKLQTDQPFSKLALADLNGDGKYDYIIKYPLQATDPGSWRRSPDTFKIEAYLSDGTYLWTKDLGWNIELGVWYSPFIVYDFNGDGRAEVAVKTAPTDHDYRDSEGRVVGRVPQYYGDGTNMDLPAVPEYCSILDGMTGEEIDRVEWPAQHQTFGDYNRNNRNQMAVAYLDGRTPCLLLNRGTYRRMVVDAYQLNGNKLEKLWSWDGDEENPVIRSAGAHSMTCVDLDGDGRDEIVMGSMVIDDNGEALWSRGIGHPDNATVGVIDPSHPGIQILYAVEVWLDDAGVCLVDGKTGEYIWKIGHPTTHVGYGFAADIDPAHPGLETFAAEDPKAGSHDKYMHTADGRRVDIPMDEIPGGRNWMWWDADLLREMAVAADPSGDARNPRRQTVPAKFMGETLPGGPFEGNIVMVADIMGDWREEVITCLPGEIRIYTTPIPAQDRRVCLMQDPLYRNYVANRSMGYDQPAMVSYYLGVDPADAADYEPLIETKK